MKILIAVPTYETIYPDTFKAIYDLDKGSHECEFEFVRGYDCATARNRIAQLALKKNYDYVLMIDNDVILPKDALLNMLEHHVDVCLGYYAHRDVNKEYDGRTSICKLGEFNYTWQFSGQELEDLKADGKTLVEIHGGGMGCALINTDIFRRLAYPWYRWITYNDGGSLSEDLFFCEICGQAGIPIHTDVRVGCGHILRNAQWPA